MFKQIIQIITLNWGKGKILAQCQNCAVHFSQNITDNHPTAVLLTEH